MPTVLIPSRYCGPPDSGNGGYTCAQVARVLGGPAEVTLRKPIPIDREMLLQVTGGKARLEWQDQLIAEGARAEWTLELEPPYDYLQAQEAARHSPAHSGHPFPTCFVCGPERAEEDGLRIFPGRIPDIGGQRAFAAPWVPAEEFAAEDGSIRDEILWAALDCPTGFAAGFPYEGTLVTGRLGARLLAPVRAGERCVLLSRQTGSEGRKRFAECVLLGEDGTARAYSRATWIRLSDDAG
jgi:hypothetical protein